MHPPLLPPLLLLALAACAPGEPEAVPAASLAATGTAQPAAHAPESGTFRVLRGDSTIVTSRFRRTGTELRSELTGDPAAERVVYTAALNPDATVARMQARIFASRDARQPREQVEIAVRGDSAHVEAMEDGKTQRGSIRAPAGVIPIPMSEAIAMAEQILRRARVMGGTTVPVPILSLENGMEVGTAVVTFMGTDSARVRFTGPGSGGEGGSELIAATDAVGRLLGGRLPGQGYVIRRDR